MRSGTSFFENAKGGIRSPPSRLLPSRCAPARVHHLFSRLGVEIDKCISMQKAKRKGITGGRPTFHALPGEPGRSRSVPLSPSLPPIHPPPSPLGLRLPPAG